MKKWAYYNEFDPKAAAWIRELIKAGHITDGEVDERPIQLVQPDDVRGFIRVHWFAGIAGWDYALRLAGWADDRPVWTGSCPCQPFSAAGKRKGKEDERHLWPAFFALIDACRPAAVMGEQVASRDGLSWLDDVCDDLEAAGYATRAADLCASGFGAPHIRQRLFWMADARGERRNRIDALLRQDAGERRAADVFEAAGRGSVGGLADADQGQCGWIADGEGRQPNGQANGWQQGYREPEPSSVFQRPGPVNGEWRVADWLLCRDPGTPRWRPVEPGTFPLAHGLPARVGRLRGYGNAINAVQAAEFIKAVSADPITHRRSA